jgi:hypothetical protein
LNAGEVVALGVLGFLLSKQKRDLSIQFVLDVLGFALPLLLFGFAPSAIASVQLVVVVPTRGRIDRDDNGTCSEVKR